MRTSTQLKARLRNLARESNIEAEVLLRKFMMERFLERISVSDYRDSFILKGGMLISSIVGIGTRSTMDMDATIRGRVLSESEVASIVENVLNIHVDDGVAFTFRDIMEIREESDCPCYRVSINAVFDKTRQTLKVDITTGDPITPGEIEYSYKLLLEDRAIGILAYNLETILAEKFEAVITRGVANSRMRDFYDIFILTATQAFSADTFREALKKTVKKRGTGEQMSDIEGVMQMVEGSGVMLDLWKRYQKKYNYATRVTWKMVIEAVKVLAEKV